jgi:hypothetical protein
MCAKDGDGDLDVAVATNTPDEVAWFNNLGNHTFAYTSLGNESTAWAVHAGDLGMCREWTEPPPPLHPHPHPPTPNSPVPSVAHCPRSQPLPP